MTPPTEFASAPAVSPDSSAGPSAPAGRAAPPVTSPDEGRSRGVVILVVIALVLALAVAIFRGSYRDGPLEPSAPTAQGALAVSSVLRDTGTEVDTARTTRDAAEDLRSGRTVILTHATGLSAPQLDALHAALGEGDGRLVLVAPDASATTVLAPGVRPSGDIPVGTELSADARCGDASLQARRIQPSLHDPDLATDQVAKAYQVPKGSTGCFRSGDGAAVVRQGAVTVLGGPGLLMNAGVSADDNSAIALNLAAGRDVTWYLPSPVDPLGESSATLLDRLPDWGLPVTLWLMVSILLALLAAFHRLGPAVVEPLPVTVRAQELTIGRARMMQRAGARGAAAEALRGATCTHLASRLGLRREERLDSLLSALAPHTERSPEQLRELLGSDPPTTDTDLVRLAQELDRLEKEIDR